MKIEKSKKGELTTQQIIMIIILIISFVVLLYFIFRLNPGETSSKQICYNSVALVGKGQGLTGSLDCKTNYLCLSGGDNCKEFNPTTTVKVDTTKKDEVLKALTDEISDCWWMFGEGKLDYMGSSFLGGEVCGICSITKFDGEMQKQIPSISYQELYDYMRTTKKTESEVYLHYIYSVNTLDAFKDFYLANYLGNNIDTSKEYFILTGISKKPVWRWFTLTGVNNIPVTILEKTTENYNAIGCDEFITKAS